MEYEDAVQMVTQLVCRFRRVDSSQVDPGADLAESLGFDSLDAAELLAAIYQKTGSELAVGSYDDLRSIHSIAKRLVAPDAPPALSSGMCVAGQPSRQEEF